MMKRVLSVILLLSVVLTCLSSCGERVVFGYDNTSNTSFDGVYITIEDIGLVDNSQVTVIWHNDTEHYVSFGLWYVVERLDGDEWVNVQIADYAIPEIACSLNPHSEGEQRYNLKYFNLMIEGTYRIRTEFYLPELGIGAQSSYATFEVAYSH